MPHAPIRRCDSAARERASAAIPMSEFFAPPKETKTPWDSLPANDCSSRAYCPTAPSPTASRAPVTAKAPSSPSATSGRALQGAHHRDFAGRVRLDARLRLRRRRATSRSPRMCDELAKQAWPEGFDGLRALDRLRAEARPSPATSSTACLARGIPHRPRHLEPTASRRWPRPPLPQLRDKSRPAHDDLPRRPSAHVPATTTPWAWPRRRWRPACATWRPAWAPRASA